MAKLKVYLWYGWSQEGWAYATAARRGLLDGERTDLFLRERFSITEDQFDAYLNAQKPTKELWRPLFKGGMLERLQTIEARDASSAWLAASGLKGGGVRRTEALFPRLIQKGDILVHKENEKGVVVYVRMGYQLVELGVWPIESFVN